MRWSRDATVGKRGGALRRGKPILLCAVDWIGISNEGHRRWKETLALAVGTSPDRVSVHTLHQHDAPRCDLSAERLLEERGLGGMLLDADFVEQTLKRVGTAARQALQSSVVATHLGLGEADVHQVASSRRILGPDGKVRATRYTACRDPLLRAEPEGLIDPKVKSISFWNQDALLVVLTWYATHPQSYYLTGRAHPDFPGMARSLREATLNGVPHIHFNGAGGDVGAGKYNDGSPENRQQLAVRLADGMSRALVASQRLPIASDALRWETLPVQLPLAPHLKVASLQAQLEDPSGDPKITIGVAEDLAWAERCEQGGSIALHCLQLGRRVCCSCRGNVPWPISWLPSAWSRINSWPWQPMETTPPDISARRPNTRKAVMRPAHELRGYRLRLKECCSRPCGNCSAGDTTHSTGLTKAQKLFGFEYHASPNRPRNHQKGDTGNTLSPAGACKNR